MSNQGTIRLKVTNNAPAIEKLWNNRYKLEFFCDNNTPKEDWYYENISALLPEYGILQTTNFGSGVSEDWEAIPDSVYPDMRLVLSEYPYNVRSGKHYVKLTYETLTSSWVEEKDEDADYELNGLKRVSRTFVALPATTYDKIIGTSTIDSDGTTLYLASFKIEKTDAKWELTEAWLEAGTLSETLDNVGSRKAKVIETIGTDPVTPDGYLLANKRESNFEGFQTNQFTFLKPSVLSRNIDTRENGKLKVETVESFSLIPSSTIGGVLISQGESDIGGIPTKRYVYAFGSGVISTKTDKRYEGSLTVTTTTSLGAPSGTSNISSTIREEDGYTLYVNVGASGSGIISDTTDERSNGAIKINKIVSVGAAATPVGTVIGRSERKSEGHTVYETTGAFGSGQISTSTRPGPNQIIGTRYVTVRSVGVQVTPPGVVTAESSTESDGYVTFETTALQGTVEGIKMTYEDVVDVEVPGTVECTTEPVSISDGTLGTIGGTIAVPKITPPRSKKIHASVTVEVTTSPASTGGIAYDLGQISCSVTSTNENYASRNGPTKTYKSGIFKYLVTQ